MPHPRFHPVMMLPPGIHVRDLSAPSDVRPPLWSVGRYDEIRRGMYTAELFGEGGLAEVRCLHVGIDLGAPLGVAVHAFAPGTVVHQGALPAPGDYGHAVVIAHEVGDALGEIAPEGVIYALYGHLAARSLALRRPGDRVEAGEVIGWIGPPEENGGWPPHLHLQLCRERPATHDLPGVVRPAERAEALRRYPDPRLVLGPIY